MTVLVPSIMGRAKFQEFLPENCHRKYSCVHCRAHLANHDELISKVSQCRELNKLVTELHFIVVSRQPGQGIPLQQSVSIRDKIGRTRKVSPRLVSCSVNVKCGKAEERYLLTGLHAVADIHCNCCKTTLGWKYVS